MNHSPRFHEVETILIAAGFDPLKQPERQRLACWLGAADGTLPTHCPVDGTFYHPMPPQISRILTRFEDKRIAQGGTGTLTEVAQ